MNPTPVPADLRRTVHARAEERCEYCLTPALVSLLPLQVDHVVAQKHGGETVAENLALCCAVCNQNKGSDLSSLDPVDGTLTPLYHPRRDRWGEHFDLRGLFIVPKTPAGRVTVKLLRLNSPERIIEREWLVAAGVLKPPE
jgi:hypothetical protein